MKDLIEALGGTTAVARWCSDRLNKPVSVQMVSMWKRRQHIPPIYRPCVRSLARDMGVEIPAGFIPGEIP